MTAFHLARPGDLAQQAEDLLDLCHLDLARAYLDQAGDPLAASPEAGCHLACVRAQLELEERAFEPAAQACLQAAELARATGSGHWQLRALVAEIGLDLAMGQSAEAWRILEGAFEQAQAWPANDRVEFELWRSRSHAHIVLGQQEEALKAADRALAAARRWGQPKAVAAALANQAGRWYALGFRLKQDGDPAAGIAALQQCVALSLQAAQAAVQARFPRLLPSILNNQAGAHTQLEQDDLALACFGQLYAMGDRTGLQAVGVFARLNHARLLFRRQRAAESMALIDEGLALGRRLRTPAAVYALHLQASRQHEAQGDFEQALRSYKLYHEAEAETSNVQAQARAGVMAVRLRTREAQTEAQQLRQLTERLSQQALRDTLTGLPNRRAMEDALRGFDDSQRSPGSDDFLAVIDVDHFKRINDGHSHAVGDQVLRALGDVCSRQLRDSDLLARWGGEEFILLMRACTPADALAVCERLRCAVQEHDWPAVAPGLAVTISIGLAARDGRSASESPGDLAAWLHRADEQLYRSKHNGRNQVSVA